MAARLGVRGRTRTQETLEQIAPKETALNQELESRVGHAQLLTQCLCETPNGGGRVGPNCDIDWWPADGPEHKTQRKQLALKETSLSNDKVCGKQQGNPSAILTRRHLLQIEHPAGDGNQTLCPNAPRVIHRTEGKMIG